MYEKLIEAFLEVNPDPSDDQFHALAHAVGIDKEELEAVSYKMLGNELEDSKPVLIALTDEELVQQGDLEPDTADLAVLVDFGGEPDPESRKLLRQ